MCWIHQWWTYWIGHFLFFLALSTYTFSAVIFEHPLDDDSDESHIFLALFWLLLLWISYPAIVSTLLILKGMKQMKSSHIAYISLWSFLGTWTWTVDSCMVNTSCMSPIVADTAASPADVLGHSTCWWCSCSLWFQWNSKEHIFSPGKKQTHFIL